MRIWVCVLRSVYLGVCIEWKKGGVEVYGVMFLFDYKEGWDNICLNVGYIIENIYKKFRIYFIWEKCVIWFMGDYEVIIYVIF